MILIGVAKEGADELCGEVRDALDRFYPGKRYVSSRFLTNLMMDDPGTYPAIHRLNTHQNQVRVVSMVLRNLGYTPYNRKDNANTYIAPEEVPA